jgi:phage terminase large subunit
VNSAETLARWRMHPDLFVRECLKAVPDRWQDKVLKAFPHNQRICLRACKGPGKTTLEAWLTWNFMATRPHPKMAATSITKDNLEDNFWPELAKWRNNSPFLKEAFEWNKTRIFAKDHPETWFCSARTWPKHADSTQQADTLAGLHADYLMFVLDESGGIPDAVMASAEAGLATGKECKLIQAGNPTHLEGPLYRACTSERHLWYVVEITGDPDDPDRAPRISKQWAREQIEKYGRDNPWVLVNVFGKFPPASINTLLGVDEVRVAMKRHLRSDQYDFSQKRLGIDVARFGDDSTMIFPRQGLAAFRPVEMKAARTNDVAARVAKAKESWGPEMIFVDATGGYGGGVEDSLLQAGIGSVPVSFAGKSIDPRYYNKRSEMWFLMAEWVKRGAALPNDPELLRELTTPTYTFHHGRFRLEEKDHIKQRLGYSPDRADALALTFALPEMPREMMLPGMQERGKLKYEYDPIHD